MTPPSPNFQTNSSGYYDENEGETFLAIRRSLQPDPADSDIPVRVISYMGSASNKIGNDGDFYLDEMANILYGPKTDGVWPEQGAQVAGPILCKRTFIQLNPARIKRALPRAETSKRRFLRVLITFLRLCRPIRSREMISLHIQSRA